MDPDDNLYFYLGPIDNLPDLGEEEELPDDFEPIYECEASGNSGWYYDGDCRQRCFCEDVSLIDTNNQIFFDLSKIFDTKLECECRLNCFGDVDTPPDCSSVLGPPADDPDDPGNPGVQDDPHFKSWTGDWFDYMGECDLQLMHVPLFDGSQDMHIQIRTKIR